MSKKYADTSDGMEMDYCSECENEFEIKWSISEQGFETVCPVCGVHHMLCSACNYRHDAEFKDDCDFHWIDEAKTIGTCRFYGGVNSEAFKRGE